MRRNSEATALQSLSPQHVAAAIPVQDADLIRSSIEEDEQMAAQRVELELCLHVQAQAVYALAGIHRPRRHV